jgi:peptide/nickel transport system permease protein
MLMVIVRRLVIAVPTVFAVATFTFLLLQLVPGSPADYILGGQATRAQVDQINAELGLNRPVFVQYLHSIGNLLRGNFGKSYTTGQSVRSELAVSLPPTFALAILATLVALVVGLALGTIAAVRGGRLDAAIQTFSSLGLAIPNFWLAAILVIAFSLKLTIFPATGFTPLNVSPEKWIVGLVLPVVAVAAAGLAQIVLQARASVLDVLSRDFVRTLQAAGLSRTRILFRHVLRNAAIPVTTLAGLGFVYTLSGVVVVETIFNIPGIGTLMINAVNRHDLPTLQGAVIYFSLIVVVVNFAVDLITSWLDPRLHVA